MVGHQHIGVKGTIMCAAGLAKQLQVKPVVIPGIKAGLAVVAALGNVLGNAGQVEARRSWHAVSSV